MKNVRLIYLALLFSILSTTAVAQYNVGNDDGFAVSCYEQATCPVDTVTQNPIICQGDSVVVGTNTYTTTGTFIDTLTNVLGCDSIITTNLTVNPTATGTDVIVSCTPITWNGITYSASTNTPKDTLIAANGCDSIVTLDLTINSAATGTDVIVSCTPITWNGIVYSASTNTPTDTLIAANGCDSIVTLNLTINSAATGTDVIVSCTPITWIDGNNYSASTTTPTDTLVAANGCDSIVTLNLTINSAATGTDVIVSCMPITWIDGIVYSASTTTPTDTLVAANGCDSIVTLDLTINNAATGTDVIVSCTPITWIDGIVYSASTNTPTDTLIAANGCDSIVTLNLTINSAATGTDVIVSCTPITWNGIVYTASTNTPTDTLIGGAANGCDSIVTLDLTINSASAFTQNPTICQGDSVVVNGNIYTTSGTFTDTIVGGAANGCDSIITTNLTVNPTATGTDVIVSCTPITWINGIVYSASTNTPTDTLIAANGCDSIVTLNLTINSAATGTDVIVSCTPITWNGIVYSASTNTPTDTLIAANGCDSIVTLNLTINSAATGTDVIVSCTPITWIDGIVYSASTNTPTDTLIAANGCDSVVTLNLTINSATTGTDVIVSCTPINWIDGNNYAASTTTPTFTLTGGAANGCDSIVTLDLTITTPTSTTQNFVECEGFSVTVGTNTYTTTGTFVDIVNGCDTVITNLTINPKPQLTLIKADDNCGEQIGEVAAVTQTTNPPIVYSWSTGSTDSIINNLPSGTYSLIISDASGCSDTAQTFVDETAIDCDFFVYLPNAFTPNNDGNNDVFFVRGRGIATMSLKIYNRWGNKVFESDDITQGWDGKYKGKEQNTGVFVFVVQGTFLNGKSFDESGDVSLIR